MKTIAFGPERRLPSWRWVGFDTSTELSKYFKIEVFDNFYSIPKADIVVIIKQNCKAEIVEKLKRRNSKVVYCPIDFYQSIRYIKFDSLFIKQCDMVLVHSERLLPIFKTYNDNVHFVEHHNKYGLPEMAPYREKGFVLWIGGCQYIPYLLDWLKNHPIKNEIKILTDARNDKAIYLTKLFAKSIGMELDIGKNPTSIAGIDCYPWSEKLQYEMMKECKAAIDIKRTDQFNQNYKPPTKAQKYISSGIPFAINKESYSSEYFRNRGFELSTPDSTSKWFSPEYWEETKMFGEKLRTCISLENVGLKYKELIDQL